MTYGLLHPRDHLVDYIIDLIFSKLISLHVLVFCSCAYLSHALLFYVLCLVFHLSRCFYVMSDVFVLSHVLSFCSSDGSQRVMPRCVFFFAIYGKLPNLENSLFGSCMLCCVYTCDAYALPNSPHALFA